MKINNVKCQKCGVEFYLKPSRIKRAKYNYCSTTCSNSDKSIRNVGENNPNRRYVYDDNFFDHIDSEFKAWFLGWILSDGGIGRSGNISIQIHKRDINILKTFQKHFLHKEIRNIENRNLCKYHFSSKKMVRQIKHYAGIDNPECFKISENMTEIRDIPEEFVSHFIRGYFEGDGNIRRMTATHKYPAAKITSRSKAVLEWIQKKINIHSSISEANSKNGPIYDLHYWGVSMLDFLSKLYDNCNYRLERKYYQYIHLINWEPKIAGGQHQIDNIKISRTTKDAVVPTKAHGSDSGYDLTIISKCKEHGDMVLYDTGICVEPPHGFYFDVVPRSSIVKTGYILANSVGIIDRSYVGSIKIGLLKIDKTAPDITLPCRIAQMILRPVFHFEIMECEKIHDTERGTGGFGSTGVK